MSAAEINRLVAEECGWKRITMASPVDGKTQIELWRQLNGRTTFAHSPDYYHSLDAMHEAEKTLTEKEQVFYLTKLLLVRYRTGADHGMIACMQDKLAFATAPQRAEAFLRVKGKWKEAK